MNDILLNFVASALSGALVELTIGLTIGVVIA